MYAKKKIKLLFNNIYNISEDIEAIRKKNF